MIEDVIRKIPNFRDVTTVELAKESGESEENVRTYVKSLENQGLVEVTTKGNQVVVKATKQMIEFRSKGYLARYDGVEEQPKPPEKKEAPKEEIPKPEIKKEIPKEEKPKPEPKKEALKKEVKREVKVVEVKKQAVEPKRPLAVDKNKVLKWMVITGRGDLSEPQRKFSLTRRQLDDVLEALQSSGDVRVEKKRKLFFFKDSKVKVLESENVKNIMKDLSPAQWDDGYKKMFRTRIDVIVGIVDEFDSVRASTLAQFFKTDMNSMTNIGHMLNTKNMIAQKEHSGGDSTLRKVE